MPTIDTLIGYGTRLATVFNVDLGKDGVVRLRVAYYDAEQGETVKRWVDIAEVNVGRKLKSLIEDTLERKKAEEDTIEVKAKEQ